jgi:hypothetical protein
MNLGKSFANDEPQPEEERDLRVGQIAGKLRDGVGKPILQNIRRIDPATNPAIEAGLDHPPEPVPVTDERLPRGR